MFLRKDNSANDSIMPFVAVHSIIGFILIFRLTPRYISLYRRFIETLTEEDVGLLVQVGFDITAFTPPAYQRGSLPRPSKDDSS